MTGLKYNNTYMGCCLNCHIADTRMREELTTGSNEHSSVSLDCKHNGECRHQNQASTSHKVVAGERTYTSLG